MATESLRRGDTATWDLPVVDDHGAPFDLTGCTLWFTVKAGSVADADAVVSCSWVDGGASSGIAVDNPLTGIAVYGITAAQSAALALRIYSYDVQLKDTIGAITTLVIGSLAVSADVTLRTTTP